MTGLATPDQLEFYFGTTPEHLKLHILLWTNCCELPAKITGCSSDVYNVLYCLKAENVHLGVAL